MILTCPECATSFFVDDALIPPAGRTVKCSACGARWRAVPEVAEAAPETAGEPPRAAPPEPALPPEPDAYPPPLDIEATPIEAGGPAPFRRPAPPRRKASRGGLLLAAGLGAALVLGLGAAVVFRHKVVDAAPATAPLFAMLGLPTGSGLLIEGVRSKVGFAAGEPVLSVTGAVRNTRKEPSEAAAIEVSLLDAAGKVVARTIARPANAEVPPGAVRYFSVNLRNPPKDAHDLRIGFAADTREPAGGHAAPATQAHATAPPAAQVHAEAETPLEAKPLPSGAPDALSHHE